MLPDIRVATSLEEGKEDAQVVFTPLTHLIRKVLSDIHQYNELRQGNQQQIQLSRFLLICGGEKIGIQIDQEMLW